MLMQIWIIVDRYCGVDTYRCGLWMDQVDANVIEWRLVESLPCGGIIKMPTADTHGRPWTPRENCCEFAAAPLCIVVLNSLVRPSKTSQRPLTLRQAENGTRYQSNRKMNCLRKVHTWNWFEDELTWLWSFACHVFTYISFFRFIWMFVCFALVSTSPREERELLWRGLLLFEPHTLFEPSQPLRFDFALHIILNSASHINVVPLF